MGQIYGENSDLAGGTQVRVPDNRQKLHCLRREKILDVYENFNTYVVVGLLRDTTNFVRLDVRRHVMNLEASRLVSRLFHNNIYTAVL